MSSYVSNCPNCGAPLTSYGVCKYCGTTINQPLQIITAVNHPGIKKIKCLTKVSVDFGTQNPELVVEHAKRDMMAKMADALSDSVKFVVRKDFDPMRFEEVICIAGEVWVADQSYQYH